MIRKSIAHGVVSGIGSPFVPPPFVSAGGGGPVLIGDPNQYIYADSGDPIIHYTMDNIVESSVIDEMGTLDAPFVLMTATEDGKFSDYLAGGAHSGGYRYFDLGEDTAFKSVSLWVRNVNENGFNTIFANSAKSRILYVSFGVLYLWNGGANAIDSIPKTGWNHIVMVEGSDSDHHYAFYNGTKSTEEVSNFGGVFRYFGQGSATNQYSPDFDNVQIYDYKLSDEEAAALYAAGTEEEG